MLTMTENLANASAGAGGTVEELGATLGLVNGLIMDLAIMPISWPAAPTPHLRRTASPWTESARIPTACRPISPVSPAICGILTASLDRTAKEAEALLKETGSRSPISPPAALDFTLLMTELRGLVTNLTRVTTRLERDPGDFLFGGTRQGVDVQ